MRIWLITIGEPLPTDGPNQRLLRTGILANLLVASGHEVTWWTSSFNHTQKRFRSDSDNSVFISDRFQIKLLHSIKYSRNISIRRIVNQYKISKSFFAQAELEKNKPDIIMSSLPTIELAVEACRFGKKNGLPVIIDVRDLWPDVFVELAPSWMSFFAKLILKPMFDGVQNACSNATAIIGITSNYVDWGLRYAQREKSVFDRYFSLGYPSIEPDEGAVKDAEDFWKEHGLSKNKDQFVACFFGTLGRQFELETVITAARKLQNEPLKFVICGEGDRLLTYKKYAGNCKNIIFPGWIGAAQIWTLMRISSIGLAPYQNTKNFKANLPNKCIEYLSAGLPIVSSLSGVLEDLLCKHKCGINYNGSDADQLASILFYLYKNQEVLNEMSINAYKLYQKDFVAEKVYGDMIHYLEAVCSHYKEREFRDDSKLLANN